MGFDELMGLTNRLVTQVETLAALTARLRLDRLGEEGDPDVRRQVDRVVDGLDVGDACERLEDGQRDILTAFARSYLRQALDLIEEPARPGSWTYDDPAVLQAQGSASGVVAGLIAGAGLGRDDARILDVGSGVSGLSIAFCEAFPRSTVVGLEPWAPSLALARENIAAVGLEDRITLAPEVVEAFHDDEGFDLVWLPSFFIPRAALEGAMARLFAVTRPGAEVVVGTFERPDDLAAAAVEDLRTVRSGGSVLTTDESAALLVGAGFTDAALVERTWNAPLDLVVGRRP